MIIETLAVVLILATVGIIIVGTLRHGWSNFYLISIGLVIASSTLLIASHLA